MTIAGIEKVYAICASSRSGSTLLCHLLTAAGLGEPREYLNPDQRHKWINEPERVPESEAYRRILEKTARPLWGTKLVRIAQYQLLDAIVGIDNVVWLRRRDKLRQAISLFRAQTSRRWVRWPQATPEPQQRYDFAAIRTCLGKVESHAQRWGKFFDEHGIATANLWYEDLVNAPPQAVMAVARLVSADPLDIPWDEVRPRTEQQADGLSEYFLHRYLEDSERG